jgi:hypothetical protein
VSVYPCTRPGKSSLLRLSLCIEMTQHAGCINKLAVLKEGAGSPDADAKAHNEARQRA